MSPPARPRTGSHRVRTCCRQALEYFARLEIDGSHERLEPIRGRRLSQRRLVDEFTELLLPQLRQERWRTVAQYAFMQEAARRPELEAVCREWSEAWEDELAELFDSLGTPSPRLEAKMFLAMLDGSAPGTARRTGRRRRERRPAPRARGLVRAPAEERPIEAGAPASRRSREAYRGARARRLRRRRWWRFDGGSTTAEVGVAPGRGRAHRRAHHLQLAALHRQEDRSLSSSRATGVSVKYVEDINSYDEFFGKMRPQLADGQSGGRSLMVAADALAEEGCTTSVTSSASTRRRLLPALEHLSPVASAVAR